MKAPDEHTTNARLDHFTSPVADKALKYSMAFGRELKALRKRNE
ncbi:hypothetical protein [Streptomyces sp. NPDC019224]